MEARRSTRPLEEIMSDLSREAQANGLTEEKLQSFPRMDSARFVVDTNTPVSAALMEGSTPDRAVRRAFRNGILLPSEVDFVQLTSANRRF